MKPYEKPVLVCLALSGEDVLTTSGEEVSWTDTLSPWESEWDRSWDGK